MYVCVCARARVRACVRMFVRVRVCGVMWCLHEERMSVCRSEVTQRVCMWQVKWGRGSASNPHVVVLEAGLDSLDFDEDLPLAPWL